MATKVVCVCCKKELGLGHRPMVTPAGLFCETCTENARRMFAPVEADEVDGDTHYGMPKGGW